MRVFNTMGSVGTTTKLTSTNTAQSLSAALLTDSASGRKLAAATFIFEENDIRIAIGATPTQAGLGPLMYPGDSMRIVGIENLTNFMYISADSGVHGYIQVIPEY